MKTIVATILIVLVLTAMALAQPVPPTVRIVAPETVGVATPFVAVVEVLDARAAAAWQANIDHDLEYGGTMFGNYISIPYDVMPLGPDVEPGTVRLGQFSLKPRIGTLAEITMTASIPGAHTIDLHGVIITDAHGIPYENVNMVPATLYAGPTPTPECSCTWWDGEVTESCTR